MLFGLRCTPGRGSLTALLALAWQIEPRKRDATPKWNETGARATRTKTHAAGVTNFETCLERT
eukprot:4304315-Lingulodinium_polyedra.AAC.1